MPKRIMRAFKLNEISAVDTPAQAHARMTIIKRDFSADERRQLASEGKAKPDGSYPITNTGDLKNAIHAWGRGGATASDKAWITRRAKALGATNLLPDGWVSKSNTEVDKMTTEELNELIGKAVATATADINTQLKAATDTLATLEKAKKKPPVADGDPEPDEDDAQKRAAWQAYVAKMTAKATAVATEKRDALHADDEVIKVGETEFRKSQTDPAIFAVIKAQSEEIAKERNARVLSDMAKVAEGADYGSLPGEPVAKAKVLKAIEGLGEEDRKVLTAALKAGNAALKRTFNEVGKGGGAIEGSAVDKLDKLAEAHAKQHNLSFAEAYTKVLELPEGRELYSQTRDERPSVRAN